MVNYEDDNVVLGPSNERNVDETLVQGEEAVAVGGWFIHRGVGLGFVINSKRLLLGEDGAKRRAGAQGEHEQLVAQHLGAWRWSTS